MSDAHTEHHEHKEGDIHVHVVPIKVLLGVFGVLMVLTVLTVAVRQIDLGPFNIWLAMIIAVIKAAFVCLWFMHLKYDRPFHGIVLVISFVFVIIFIGFTLTDTKQYAPNMQAPINYGAAP
jgi:cytochrome c oxidase subunit IV